jgi:hypothetical protein
MKTSIRRERSRFRPTIHPLEERCTPTVSTVQFFAITPAPSLGTGSAEFDGIITDSQSSPVASAHLAAFYQVLDLHGNLLAGGPLALSTVGGASNAASFSQTIPAGSFTPPSQGERIRIVAVDDTSLLIAGSTLSHPANSPPQNVAFGVADSNGDTVVGNGTATVNESDLADGGNAITGRGTITAIGRNRNGSTLFTSSGNGLFAIANHPSGASSVVVNGAAAAKVGTGSVTVNATVRGKATVVIDASAHVSVVVAGAVNAAVRTPVGTFTGSAQNATVSVITDSSGHVTVSVSGKLKLGVS